MQNPTYHFCPFLHSGQLQQESIPAGIYYPFQIPTEFIPMETGMRMTGGWNYYERLFCGNEQ